MGERSLIELFENAIRFVSVRSVERQDIKAVHRVPTELVEQRTANF